MLDTGSMPSSPTWVHCSPVITATNRRMTHASANIQNRSKNTHEDIAIATHQRERQNLASSPVNLTKLLRGLSLNSLRNNAFGNFSPSLCVDRDGGQHLERQNREKYMMRKIGIVTAMATAVTSLSLTLAPAAFADVDPLVPYGPNPHVSGSVGLYTSNHDEADTSAGLVDLPF